MYAPPSLQLLYAEIAPSLLCLVRNAKLLCHCRDLTWWPALLCQKLKWPLCYVIVGNWHDLCYVIVGVYTSTKVDNCCLYLNLQPQYGFAGAWVGEGGVRVEAGGVQAGAGGAHHQDAGEGADRQEAREAGKGALAGQEKFTFSKMLLISCVSLDQGKKGEQEQVSQPPKKGLNWCHQEVSLPLLRVLWNCVWIEA